MQKSIMLFAGLGLLTLSCVAAAAECRYSAPRNAELDAAGLKTLAVEIGADNLVIQGQPGLTKIVVHGTACASNEKWLQDVKVETARRGDTASVVAHDGGHNVILSLFGGSYAYLKLDVRVPQSLAVKLEVGSGDAHASGLAALDATLGSGDLKVDDVTGRLALSVGSGDAVARTVGGLDLSTMGSGDVTVEGVNGDAAAGTIGSGDLGLRDVKGNVSIGSVASGDVKLADVVGSVKVGSVGSGDVGIRDVKGDVLLKAVASGDVDIQRAGGNVRADSIGSGDFGANGVGGDFSVGVVGSGDVHHAAVKGKVSVPRTDD